MLQLRWALKIICQMKEICNKSLHSIWFHLRKSRIGKSTEAASRLIVALGEWRLSGGDP